jgi:hypothetical protein
MKNENKPQPRRLLALLAVVAFGAGATSALAAVTGAEDIVADWPESSRLTALAMIERHGQPEQGDERALTWFGIYRGLRTIVHRADDGGAAIEQVVRYRVPERKVEDLKRFDARLAVDAQAAELSARANDERTNFLLLNLAHEIASGFRTVSEAQSFYRSQTRLEESGKTTRYRSRLLFEDNLPFSRPWASVPAPRAR